MSRSRCSCLLGVLGTVGFCMALATASEQRPDDQSQRAADIRWFLDKAELIARHAPWGADACKEIAVVQSRAGDLEGALRTVAAIEYPGMRVNTYCSMAEAQAKAGNTAAFRRLIENAKQVAAGIGEAWAYCAIAKVEVESGDVAAAKQTIELAKRTATAVGGFDYEAIAELQLMVGDFAGAVPTAAAIGHAETRAKVYCSIAEAQSKAGDNTSAREQLALAKKAVAAMANASDRPALYRQIAAAQVRTGDIAGAMATVGVVDAIDIPWWKDSAREGVAAAQAQAGDLDEAKKTAAGIQDGSVKARADREIAEAQARAGDSEGATATASQIEDAWEKVVAYCSIADLQVEVGNLAGFKETVARALQVAGVFDVTRQARSYSRIAEAQMKAADLAGALDTAARIPLLPDQVRLYCAIAHAQATVGNTVASKEAIGLAHHAAGGIRDASQKTQAYCSVAAVLAEVGSTTASRLAFDVARDAAANIEEEEGSSGSGWSKAYAYAQIAEAQTRAGQVEEVKAWVETLKEPEEVVQVCLGAVEGLLPEEGSKAAPDRSR